jgi:hypothetical protein
VPALPAAEGPYLTVTGCACGAFKEDHAAANGRRLIGTRENKDAAIRWPQEACPKVHKVGSQPRLTWRWPPVASIRVRLL